MRIAICQLDPMIGAFKSQLEKLLSYLNKAKKEGCVWAIFPECFLCGYPAKDLLLHNDFIEDTEKLLAELLPHTKEMGVVIGLPRRNPDHKGKPLLNSAAIIFDGKLKGFQDKIRLPDYNVFDERRYFAEGEGDIKVWKEGGLSIALVICEDAWSEIEPMQPEYRYSKDPMQTLEVEYPDVLINLSASPFTKTKQKKREKNLREITKRFKCPALLVNQVGAQDSLIFDGASFVMDAEGNVCQQAACFEEDMLVVDIAKLPKEPFPICHDAVTHLRKALVLGIRDYFNKQSLKYAYIGISGGIDSAVTAALAIEALGADRVRGVAMPSRYSSDISLLDAKLLAKNLKMQLDVVPIEDAFKYFTGLLAPLFEGKAEDVTEENIQARLRGVILMALANKHHGIVLTTGNKSELAMGYCTLYGDLCGGLSVINDLWKTEVYTLANHFNEKKLIIPQNIIDKAPTAELRENQKDQDTLPEYDLLDAILKLYIEKALPTIEIAKELGVDIALVKEIVKTVHRQEFKRRQAPLGLIVSDRAFTQGYQYPVVQKWR